MALHVCFVGSCFKMRRMGMAKGLLLSGNQNDTGVLLQVLVPEGEGRRRASVEGCHESGCVGQGTTAQWGLSSAACCTLHGETNQNSSL